MTQLSLSDFPNHQFDERPLPLITADKWGFALYHVDRTGDAADYLYCARDWYIGLGGKKNAWSMYKNDWLLFMQPVEMGVKRPRRPIEMLEFVNAGSLYAIAVRMENKPDRPQLEYIKRMLAFIPRAIPTDLATYCEGDSIPSDAPIKARQNKSEYGNPKPNSRHGFVYLLQSASGFYKIGRTSNPSNRLATFEVRLPFEVNFIALIETVDMFTLERELHNQFESKRGNGEWFALSAEDVAHIQSIAG